MAEVTYASFVEGTTVTPPTVEELDVATTDGTNPLAAVNVAYLNALGGGQQNFFSAVVAPTANDDSGDGYSVGSVWLNTVTGIFYQAVSVGVGTAVWREQVNANVAQTIAGAKTFNSPASFTDTTQSTTKDTGAVVLEGGLGVEKNVNVGGDIGVGGNVTIAGQLSVATLNTINSTAVEVADANIIVNNGGNQASANTNVAGFTVEMSDATHARVGYDSNLASKFKAGEVGNESEIITANAAQAINNKTQINVDNLRLDGNTLSSTDTNGDVNITPNGTGTVVATKLKNTGISSSDTQDDATSGANVTLAAPTKQVVRLTNAALTSISEIPAGVNAQVVVLINLTGNAVTINDETGATAANRIKTGRMTAISLTSEGSLYLVYDTTSARWMVTSVTGSGGGATDLDGLTDVAITSAVKGDVLVHNGTQFINSQLANDNLLVGGGMDHWLDSTTLSGITSGYLGTLCRFSSNTDGTYNITRSTNVPSGGTALYSGQIEVATADASIGAAQRAYTQIAVEGTDFREIYGKKFTVGGKIWFNITGTFHIALTNAAANRCYPATVVYAVANTWTDVSITVDHDTTGTWVLDQSNGGLYVWVTLDAGTNFHGTANAWNGGSNLISSAAQSNFSATVGNIFRFTEFKVEKGGVATPYTQAWGGIHRYGRYFQKSYSYANFAGAVQSSGAVGLEADATGSILVGNPFQFEQSMRDAPSVAIYGSNSGTAGGANAFGTAIDTSTTLTANGVSDKGIYYLTGTGSPFTPGVTYFIHYTASSRLT